MKSSAFSLQVVDLPSTVKVEVYSVEIYLCLSSNMESTVSACFSRADKIREYRLVMDRKVFGTLQNV